MPHAAPTPTTQTPARPLDPSSGAASLRLVLAIAGDNAGRWREDFRRELPGARVTLWPEADPEATIAAVWKPPQAFFDAHPRVRSIFNLGAGVDALAGLTLPTGASLYRLEDAGMGAQMNEYVCHALLRHVREFDRYDDDARGSTAERSAADPGAADPGAADPGSAGRSDEQRGASTAVDPWRVREPRRPAQFPVGVMGLGVLGAQIARTLVAFGFPVHGWSRSPASLPGITCHAGADGLDAFLGEVRILVCVLPLTPATTNILNRRTLSRLQRPGYLVNIARGGHLVDEDLIALIDDGQMAGACLDVFRTEPLPVDHPLRSRPAITITPHISAQTLHAEALAQVVANLRALQAGERLTGLVDPERGY